VNCNKCVKRTGWLAAIPLLMFLPKCPLCWLAYLSIAEAFLLSKTGWAVGFGAIAAVVIGLAAFLGQRRLARINRISSAEARCIAVLSRQARLVRYD
jgi:hypothetical protein